MKGPLVYSLAREQRLHVAQPRDAPSVALGVERAALGEGDSLNVSLVISFSAPAVAKSPNCGK
jgi:hypothetical protein